MKKMRHLLLFVMIAAYATSLNAQDCQPFNIKMRTIPESKITETDSCTYVDVCAGTTYTFEP